MVSLHRVKGSINKIKGVISRWIVIKIKGTQYVDVPLKGDRRMTSIVQFHAGHYMLINTNHKD